MTRIQKIQLEHVALLVWQLLEFDHHAGLCNDGDVISLVCIGSTISFTICLPREFINDCEIGLSMFARLTATYDEMIIINQLQLFLGMVWDTPSMGD